MDQRTNGVDKRVEIKGDVPEVYQSFLLWLSPLVSWCEQMCLSQRKDKYIGEEQQRMIASCYGGSCLVALFRQTQFTT